MFNFLEKTLLSCLLGLFFTAPLFACEPCAEILDMQEAVQEADLVIIGKRTDFTEAERDQWRKQEGPSEIEIEVLEVLKGKAKGKNIKARSWYAMCDYGIVIDDKTYLLALKEGEQDLYTSVRHGCAFKKAPYRNGRIILIEEQSISLKEISEMISSLTKGTEKSSAAPRQYIPKASE